MIEARSQYVVVRDSPEPSGFEIVNDLFPVFGLGMYGSGWDTVIVQDFGNVFGVFDTATEYQPSLAVMPVLNHFLNYGVINVVLVYGFLQLGLDILPLCHVYVCNVQGGLRLTGDRG